MKDEIINIKNEAISRIMEAKTASSLEEIRINYLGRSGRLTKLIKDLKDVPSDKRKETGITLNESKNTILEAISSKKALLSDSLNVWFDPTVPGLKPNFGNIHIITKAIKDISDIFEKMGFVRVRYPEVEWDWFPFEALNMPKDHPARDEWETFFVDQKPDDKLGQMVLTPHTSSGQIREMMRVKNPPIRMINIAKCYRRQSDPSHSVMFHQFEGLVIDTDINIGHLKGTLNYFFKSYFGNDAKSRLRPYHFQFTEPSFEVDVSCSYCSGKGCKLCKEGWMELGGSGMVHPNVLKAGGIDPKKYSGFAFGWGVERVLMMKPNTSVSDLRLLYTHDINILKQF